jgi:hypothetical protein
VETIELGYDRFMEIAKEHGAFKELKALTLGLLYPRVFPDVFQRAFAMVRHLPGPPSYPSSDGYEVKPFAARVTKEAALPLGLLHHRPRTDAGLYVATDEAASAFTPPVPTKAHQLTSLSDDDDDQLLMTTSTDGAPLHGARRSSSQSIGPHDKSPTHRRGDATIGATTAGGPSKAQRGPANPKSKAAEIERLAARIRELQRCGPTMAGSPARATRSQRVGGDKPQGQSTATSPSKSTAASPAKPTAAATSSSPTSPEAKTRTVALQTMKSHLMTRYKQLQRGEVPDDELRPSAERLPDNCGAEPRGASAPVQSPDNSVDAKHEDASSVKPAEQPTAGHA